MTFVPLSLSQEERFPCPIVLLGIIVCLQIVENVKATTTKKVQNDVTFISGETNVLEWKYHRRYNINNMLYYCRKKSVFENIATVPLYNTEWVCVMDAM